MEENPAMNEPDPSRRGFGSWLWRRPRRWYLLGIPAGGLLAVMIGVGLTGGFFGGLKYASTEAFCSTSCHEMNTPSQELSHTVHYTNQVGIRATCADCHVPPAFIPGLVRHFMACQCVWGHITLKLNTPAKYEAHRLDMAQQVWKELKGNDSAECRSCHTPAAMAFAKQPAAAASAHQGLATSGMTCIDCHKGLAHSLPEGS
jgi:cytochrome c-type protein NapC